MMIILERVGHRLDVPKIMIGFLSVCLASIALRAVAMAETAILWLLWKCSSVDGFNAMATRTRRVGFIQSEQNPAISHVEVRGTAAGAIHDQELMFDENGLGNHRT